MKRLLLFGVLALSINAFGQSKKEQIVALNYSIDSLNTVLSTARDKSSKDIQGLNSEITQLKNDVSSLESSTTKLTKENKKLKLDMEKMSKSILELERKCSGVKIGNLEVMTEDLGYGTWDEAMKACADLGDGWRLPTRDELNVLYKNKDKIGGFATVDYWSSTENDSGTAYGQDFGNGGQTGNTKNTTFYVRAVRAF